MYPPMEMDNGTYYLKPMNCPMHCLIFRAAQRSYRELPLRLFELGTVYRYERAGTLHGLLRIRGFTQDDSHIFCTAEQLADEIALAARLRAVGAAGLRVRGLHGQPVDARTRRSPSAPTRSGSEATDGAARGARRATASSTPSRRATPRSTARRSTSTCATPSAASWQLSTIQFDFNHPERFELEYVGADNARHRPIMLHRALFGSIERFFGVLLEHYAGAFPTWLAPVQVRVLPVADGPRGVRRRRSPTASRGRRVPGRRRRAPTSSSASASARPSWRSCRTCSWSATTTSPTARSASTRAAARSSATCPSTTFVERLAAEVRRGHRRGARPTSR